MTPTSLFKLLPKPIKIPSFGPAVVYGLAGIAFIFGTLVMSLAMPAAEFAEATLLVAVCNLAVAAGPAGMNGIVLRYNLRTDAKLLSIGALVVLIFALLTTAIVYQVYDLPISTAAILFTSVLTGGLAFSAIPKLQRRRNFVGAAYIAQSSAIWMSLAALVMLTGFAGTSWFPLILITAGFIVSCIVSFKTLVSHRHTDTIAKPRMWKEAMHFWGIALSSELMSQLERLLIPFLLDIKAVGSFAVVAAVAIAPYRVIELATATTLVTRLQSAKSAKSRMQVFYRESLLLIPISVGGGAVLLFAGLPICEFVRPDVDDITYTVLAMGAFSGFCRVLTSLSRSVASAFCTPRELALVNGSSWFAIAAGVLAAWALADYGLAGVILGFSIGWLTRAVLTGILCYQYLLRDDSPQYVLMPTNSRSLIRAGDSASAAYSAEAETD